ncbi:hypothetical protein V2J09_001312 [Rumex salicifolius]
MVLSNKKLKQKLREELTQSLVSSQSNPSTSITPSSSSKSQSFRQLLGAAAHSTGLSKREKRRKNLPLGAPDSATGKNDGGNRARPVAGGDGEVRVENGSSIKEKKRKRGEGDAKVDLKEASDAKKAENKAKKKKQQKKKKKMAKKKTPMKEEIQKVGEPDKVSETVSELQEDQIDVQNQGNEEVSKKVYVGGIPYYSTEDDIRSFFDHCGTITEVDCMRFPETGKFRGIAILNFMTEEAAKRAMALDGADMGGFFLKVQHYNKTTPQVAKTPAFTPPVIQGYNRIYAGNLSWDITEEDLRNLFSDCSISSIRFGEDKETGAFKGYAHVDFSDESSLEKALKLDQELVCGRPVRITCAVALRKPQSQQSTTKSAVANSKSIPQDVKDVKKSTSQNAVDNNKPISQDVVDNNISSSQNVVENDNIAPQSTVENSTGVSKGKMRRRNCYLCGERGHISSACPKQAAQQADPTAS